MSSHGPLSTAGRTVRNYLLPVSLLLLAGCGQGAGLSADRTLLPLINGAVSGELIEKLAPLQRLPGTPDFDTAIDLIMARLEEGGFTLVDEPPDGLPLSESSGSYAFVLRSRRIYRRRSW